MTTLIYKCGTAFQMLLLWGKRLYTIRPLQISVSNEQPPFENKDQNNDPDDL